MNCLDLSMPIECKYLVLIWFGLLWLSQYIVRSRVNNDYKMQTISSVPQTCGPASISWGFLFGSESVRNMPSPLDSGQFNLIFKIVVFHKIQNCWKKFEFQAIYTHIFQSQFQISLDIKTLFAIYLRGFSETKLRKFGRGDS